MARFGEAIPDGIRRQMARLVSTEEPLLARLSRPCPLIVTMLTVTSVAISIRITRSQVRETTHQLAYPMVNQRSGTVRIRCLHEMPRPLLYSLRCAPSRRLVMSRW